MGRTMSRFIWSLSDEGLVEQMSLNQDTNAKNWIFSMHDALSHGEFL